VLLPGEEFDFNRVVGARDEANGYKVASVIAQGELVDGIGGGTCQISGTLHAAAFFAGLDVVQRYPHTRPSSYIKLGLDATVVYPSINFRFRNPFDFPVVLHQSVKDGVVRAEVLGPDTGKTVTLIRRILSALPYEEVERPDDRLEHGHRVLAQRGVPGFKMRMYRVVRDGQHATREKRDVTYPPTQQIVLVGTAKATSPKAPKDSAQPEYVADELLVVTVLPNGHEEPKTLEKREPGPYGEPGWTQKLGMPYYRTSAN
jgi:VanW like protein/G5 domain